MTMKITAKMLSKEALISIVDALIATKLYPNDIFMNWYRYGLVKQVKSIQQQLEIIDRKFKSKSLSRKAYGALFRRHEQLVKLGNNKLDILKKLDCLQNKETE